jgi:hypothetical protein
MIEIVPRTERENESRRKHRRFDLKIWVRINQKSRKNPESA